MSPKHSCIFLILIMQTQHQGFHERTDSESLPGVNFINILHPTFSYEILAPEITKLKRNLRKLCNLILYKKDAHKMLMKSTIGVNFINTLHETFLCIITF